MSSEARRAQLFPEPLAAKVPEITVLFWVVKLLTTCGGEAVSDYLALGNRQVGAVVEAGLLVIALVWQFRTRRYVAAAYWSLAYAIAIFGTGVSDALHLFIGIPYAGTTLLWAVVLALIFWAWYRSEGTLSIHSIVTRRREAFYWAVVFATFALGTALGDFTASVLGLGYLASAIMFVFMILIPAVFWWRFGLNAIAAFWFAYVVTRPLGASFADYFGRAQSLSGAGFGSGRVAVDRGDRRRDPRRLPRHHPPRHPAGGRPGRRPASVRPAPGRTRETAPGRVAQRLLRTLRVSRGAWSGLGAGSWASARRLCGPNRSCRPSSRSTRIALRASTEGSSLVICPWARPRKSSSSCPTTKTRASRSSRAPGPGAVGQVSCALMASSASRMFSTELA